VLEQSEFDSFAHDLRHYLRDVVMTAQLTMRREGASMPPAISDALQRIVSSARTADQLVTASGAYLAAGRRATENWPLDRVLTKLRLDLRPVVEAANASFEIYIDPPEQNPIVPTALAPVWIELVRNGIRFQPPENIPAVRLRIVLEGALLRFVVSDNGIGIPAEYREKALGAYARLHKRSDYPGFGLGLAAARKWMCLLDGELRIVDAVRGAAVEGVCPLPAG
jgi:light-regulated signal transduction histidine kinase (bacteriophytochrome)